MRVVFMGTPDFAATSLQGLIDADFIEVVGVVTQPDKKQGRGQKLTYSPVKELSLKYDLPVYQPQNVNEPEFLDELEALSPDAIIVVAYGQLLKERLLTMTLYGCINVHGSLLPRYRGASPIHSVIINGETKTGVTIMYMAKGWDTGDMILKEEIEIGPEMTVGELHDEMAKVGSGLLVESLRQIKEGIAPRTPQNHDEATYAYKISKEECEICWTDSAQKIYNLIRGMNPWPRAYTYYKGKIFKVWKSKVEEKNTDGLPGQVVDVDVDKGILIQTGKGGIWFTEIQPANSKKMPTSAYLNGHKINIGEMFGNEN